MLLLIQYLVVILILKLVEDIEDGLLVVLQLLDVEGLKLLVNELLRVERFLH